MPTSAPPAARVVVTDEPGAAELSAWDALVAGHPGGDVTQLSGWGRVRRLAGYSPSYVLAYDADRLVGGAQVIVRRLPVLGSVGYVPYGPVVLPRAEHADQVHRVLADALRDLVRSRLRVLLVQPPMGGEQCTRDLMARGFRPSDAGISPTVSIRVRLDVDAEELRRSLPKRMRKRTNQWDRSGVSVRMGDEGDLPVAAELIKATGDHQGFTGFGLDYLTAMHRELAPGGHLVFFVGEFEGRPVAVQVCTGAGEVLTARLTGFDRSRPGASLRIPAATIWAAMRWGSRNGYRWFDFGGIEEESAAVLEAGGPVSGMVSFDQVKTDFGGGLVRYPPAVEFFASRWVRGAYDLARRTGSGSVLLDRARRIARTGLRGGPAATVARHVFAGLLKPPYVLARRALREALFDRRYGVQTEGVLTTAELALADPDSEDYMPAGLLSLRRVLPRRLVGPDDVFLDLGSGKGRAVLQAALHYPFRAVYGVELSESLHAVAERNLAAVRPRLRCPEVHLVQGDARTVEVPDTVTVAYLNNPFRGAVFDAVVARLIASVDRNPRRLRIVYGNPEEEAALLATGRVRLVRATRGWRPGRDWSRSNSFRLYEVLPAG